MNMEHLLAATNKVVELNNQLTAVTEQRDRLADALRKFVGDALFCTHADIATDVLPHQETGSAQNGVTTP